MEVLINEKQEEQLKKRAFKEWKNPIQFKSLRGKILFGFGILIIMVLGLAGKIYYTMSNMNDVSENMVDTQVALLIADERAASSLARRSTNVRAYLMTGDETYREMFEANVADNQPYFDIIDQMNDSEEIDQMIAQHDNWNQDILSSVFDVYAAGDTEQAIENLGTLAPTTTSLLNQLSEFAIRREQSINAQGEEMIQSGQDTLRLTLIVSLLVVIISVAIALITSKSISKPINKVMEKMLLITSGDLKGEPLDIASQDETGKLAEAINNMQVSLTSIITNISEVSYMLTTNSKELSESAHEVMSGTDQVAVTMQELAVGSEAQATSASKLSVIMEVFAEKINQTNKNGQYITKLSDKALEGTAKGKELMDSSEQQMLKIDELVKQSVAKVDKLDAQTQEISNLVEIIQNVANQTNLLALNAAIEAARASDQGKGFAVVADEVRKLAEQVEVSVTEITGFVETIQLESKSVSATLQEGYKEVTEGTIQIKETGETFSHLTKSIYDMSSNIKKINTNLSEIQESSLDMNTSIEEIASVSEESAAGVEQTSASTQEINSSMEEVAGDGGKVSKLVELAENMDKVVSKFIL